MKAYVLMSDNGEEYDDYRAYITAISLDKEKIDAEKFKLENPEPLVLLTEEQFKLDEELYEDYVQDYQYYTMQTTRTYESNKRCHHWIDDYNLL